MLVLVQALVLLLMAMPLPQRLKSQPLVVPASRRRFLLPNRPVMLQSLLLLLLLVLPPPLPSCPSRMVSLMVSSFPFLLQHAVRRCQTLQ